MQLHPKIVAAGLTALVAAVLMVGNAVVEVYPSEWWTGLVALGLTLAAGWAKGSPPPR